MASEMVVSSVLMQAAWLVAYLDDPMVDWLESWKGRW